MSTCSEIVRYKRNMKAVFDRACAKQPLKQQNNPMESEEQDNPKTLRHSNRHRLAVQTEGFTPTRSIVQNVQPGQNLIEV
jgi:hypothetical protein